MSGLQTPYTHETAAAVSSPPARLRKRAAYLAAARGRRLHGGAFSLQAAPRAPADSAEPRFGLTVTKKEGNAVVRNRLRRRLREALRLTPLADARPGHDYVIVARRESLKTGFARLQQEIASALSRVLQAKPAGPRRQGKPPAAAAGQGGARNPNRRPETS